MIKKIVTLAGFALASAAAPLAPASAALAAGNCDCYYEAIISPDGALVGYNLVCPELITCQQTVDP